MLHLLTKSLQLDIKIKYAEEYLYNINYFNVTKSFIKPLAKNPAFGTEKWNFKPIGWINKVPNFVVSNNFQLIVGANVNTWPYLYRLHTTYIFNTFTKLPQMSFEKQHILARHPLSQPASFDPLVPMDFWSWFFSLACFFIMTLLFITTQKVLSPTKLSLYYATDFWKEDYWCKTSSMLLFLWAISFFMINNAYQIDFRMGLISQTLETPINTWDDINMFNVHIYTFSLPMLVPTARQNFFIHKNLLEHDRHYLRYLMSTE